MSQILTAKAVTSDVGEQKSASIGVHSWAKCSLKNSERDAQRTIKKQKTKLDIPIEEVLCEGEKVPWISPESWLEFVVAKGLWPVMSGCDLHDYDGACRNWQEFWKTYQRINPSFELFDKPGVDFSRTAAWLLHGDEGRTLKRGGLLVTSVQSAIGRGYDEKRVRRSDANLQVNFAGHSFTTRYVVSTIPKTSYDAKPELFHKAMEHVAKSCRALFDKGYVDHTRGGETFRVVILGVKGDAPYLSKIAHFYRSFNTTAKRGEERGPAKGICPYCLAGTSHYPAEEISTSQPSWQQTCGIKLPWVRCPSVIKYLMHDRSDPSLFFKSDIWHIVHLGFGRSWIASTIQIILPHLPCDNLDEKWNYLTDKYIEWCSSHKKQSHISRITPYLMSYGDASGAMGNWHKGVLTTNFMLWLVDFLDDLPRTDLLLRARSATYRLNAMFSVLYRAGAFLKENECAFVSEQGLRFLEAYAFLANAMFAEGKQYLYPLYPKLHIFHHIILDVKHLGENVKIACNPAMFSCQMCEDVVGRSSRISRRVSIRKVAFRSLDRFRSAAFAAFVKAKLLA